MTKVEDGFWSYSLGFLKNCLRNKLTQVYKLIMALLITEVSALQINSKNIAIAQSKVEIRS